MLCFFFNFKVFKILSFHHFLFKLLYFNPLSILTLSSICTFVFVPFVFCLFQPLSFYLSVSLFVSLFLNKFLLSTTERNERERERFKDSFNFVRIWSIATGIGYLDRSFKWQDSFEPATCILLCPIYFIFSTDILIAYVEGNILQSTTLLTFPIS